MKTFEDLKFKLSPSENILTSTTQLENGYSMEINQSDYLLSDPHYKWVLAVYKDEELQELYSSQSKEEVTERMEEVQTTDKYCVAVGVD